MPTREAVTAGAPAAAPPVPDAARAALGDALPALEAFASVLAGPGVERGLLGPRETPRLWDRHLLNCAGPAELLAPGELVVDVGSGAGLPGVVLAALRPDCRFVLLEPLLRRASFLSEVVEALALPHVEVRRGRAEEVAGALAADVVVARAVAPLARLAGWALPLLRPGGRLLAMKGRTADAELAEAGPALTAAGGEQARVLDVGDEATLTAARVVVVVRGAGRGRRS
ncbi:MAG TPA: 16S rRNA (guanine(527)-N(7))-methyltransferase RsmG [Mycobacteriales bacterium]|nr:16S rRNA (guanine(527)-N(7))-methyltransferase RsmG [Mycobacteriales bacterium]